MSTIAVIGHGLTPKDKGWGTHIDSCDFVVRLWNWHWQNEVDYGKKYDYGFYEISAPEMNRFHKYNQRYPTYWWLATKLHSNRGHKEYMGDLLAQTAVYDSQPWELEGMALGGAGVKGRLVLTRGVRAVLSIAQLKQATQGDQIILVGFDNLRAGKALDIVEGFPEEYVSCSAVFPFRDYKGGHTKYGNHDYAVEAPLLEQISKRLGFDLVHAQDIWDTNEHNW